MWPSGNCVVTVDYRTSDENLDIVRAYLEKYPSHSLIFSRLCQIIPQVANTSIPPYKRYGLNRKLTHYAHLIRVDLKESGLLMKWIR